MLRINVIASGEQAKAYYAEQLSKGDYYAKDQAQEITGRWGGKAAEKMGLTGEVDQQSFYDLADHTNPVTKEQLTQRRNDNRRTGYDFTFSAGKSISAYYGYTKDDRILEAFQDAVQETMAKDIEPNVQVRVRQNGETEANRTTGNALYSSFTHLTSRPVDGIPDPQLHNHVVLHNVTWDEGYRNRDGSYGAWMAAEIGNVKADGQYYQAAFHARLAKKLADCGFAIEQTEHGFELAGFTQEMKASFSRRTALIEAKARELGVTYVEDKAELGAKTRERKRDDLTMSDLHAEWRSRHSEREWKKFVEKANSGDGGPRITGKEALAYGFDHTLERRSVARQSDVLAAALHRGVGVVTPESMQFELARRNDVVSVEDRGQTLVTTKAVLDEEARMIAFARDGRGTQDALGSSDFRFKPIRRDGQVFELSQQQQNAVRHVLESHSKVILLRGAAGVGKTSALAEAIRGIEQNRRQVHSFAPTTDAVGVLKQDGVESNNASLQNASTVAKLLQNKQLQSELRDQVILIDEAGLVSTPDMKRVFDVAVEQNARVILSGDFKQHASVSRGDAMRILTEQAGLKPAVIDEVRRQRNTVYRSAVEDFSRGTRSDVVTGFDKLDGMGMIQEVQDADERNDRLAEGYVATVQAGKTSLVISPTHAEGEQVSGNIRDRLKHAGIVHSNERTVTRLKNLNLTDAEKSNPHVYEPGHVVQFHKPSKAVTSSSYDVETVLGMGPHGPTVHKQLEKNSRTTVIGYNWKDETGLQRDAPVKKGLTYGERAIVLGRDAANNVHVRTSGGDVVQLPLSEACKFSVYEQSELQLAAGDQIRFTSPVNTHQRSKRDKKHRIANGSIRTLKGFTREGHLQLDNGWIVHKDAGHLTHGYVTTSHASQGKTRDIVYVAQSSQSFPASNRAQWYVSVSRAKEAVVVMTDDKQALRNQAIQRSSERMAATELAARARNSQAAHQAQERAVRQRNFMQQLNDLAKRAGDAARQKARQVREYYARIREQMRQRGPQHEH